VHLTAETVTTKGRTVMVSQFVWGVWGYVRLALAQPHAVHAMQDCSSTVGLAAVLTVLSDSTPAQPPTAIFVTLTVQLALLPLRHALPADSLLPPSPTSTPITPATPLVRTEAMQPPQMGPIFAPLVPLDAPPARSMLQQFNAPFASLFLPLSTITPAIAACRLVPMALLAEPAEEIPLVSPAILPVRLATRLGFRRV
jgi:hypothetical protein